MGNVLCVGCRSNGILQGISVWVKPLIPMEGMYLYFVGILLIRCDVGSTNVMYVVGFMKKSVSGSLSTSSMEHVEGTFCQGRRGGGKGDGGSDLVFLMHVGELNVSRGIGYVEIWVGLTCDGYKLEFVAMSILF